MNLLKIENNKFDGKKLKGKIETKMRKGKYVSKIKTVIIYDYVGKVN
jgi:hypothetical protein